MYKILPLLLLASCSTYYQGKVYTRMTTYKELGVKCPTDYYYAYSSQSCVPMSAAHTRGEVEVYSPSGVSTEVTRAYLPTPDTEVRIPTRTHYRQNKPLKRKKSIIGHSCPDIFKLANKCMEKSR